MVDQSSLVGSTQYAPAASIPLIKSPSLYLPKPIELPPDIHPLPEDIQAYFVYPFTLESHILAHGPAHRQQLQARQNAHVAYLFQREEDKKARKRAEMNRVAPGWSPGGSALVPDRPKSKLQNSQDEAKLTATTMITKEAEGGIGQSLSEDLASLNFGG
ncbi:hypothetical protein [Phaffia rhodozyma]|uniref:Uncharacterized protein n=1 Tax=Phaffia rhodozyma TaxID=264483 RepID=A0A0F7SSC3_PHARH|nr:hypothetical protein [Phaffia rhodozyma]